LLAGLSGRHMHELSLIEELLAECRLRADGRAVAVVWVRCSSAVDQVELAQGFALLAGQVGAGPDGDPCLSNAELKVESVPVRFGCSCGFAGELGKDHLTGHIGVCPACGRVGEVDAGVELVTLSFAPGRAPGRQLSDEPP
jgi:hydrogenase nickel incorporation protein HypA/HybF